MLQNLTGWHALLILAVVVLIFGAAKLPALARSVGQSMRILKQESHIDPEPAEAVAVDTVAAAGFPADQTDATPQRRAA